MNSLLGWQQDSINSGNSKLLMIFVGLAAFALFVQAIVFVVLAIGAMKTQKEVTLYIKEIHAKTMPLIATVHSTTTELAPHLREITAKVKTITAHVETISAVVLEKVHEFGPTVSAANETFAEANTTVRDANRKAQAQVARVNGMVSAVLDSTASLGAAIQHGIRVPGREIAGLMNGLRGMADSLMKRTKPFGAGKRPTVYTPPQYRPNITPYRSMADERNENTGL